MQRIGIYLAMIIYFIVKIKVELILQKVIYGLDRLILNQLKAGIDPAAYIDENIEAMKDKIIICTDIFCGIVPVDALMRRWRDDTGRIMIRLANESDSVIRIFLGMEQIIK